MKGIICILFFGVLWKSGYVHSLLLPSQDSSISDESYLLPNNTKPLHYGIKLVPYLVENNFTFDGESLIDFRVLRTTNVITINCVDLNIDEEVTVVTKKANNESVSYQPVKHVYDVVTEMLHIHFQEELNEGEYQLFLKYTGNINSYYHGFYRSFYTNENNETVWLALTHFEATHARRAFPCWDEPSLRATYDISVKHHPNYTVISNMPILNKSAADINDGKIWTSFQTTPLMSTYLISIIVSDFHCLSDNNDTLLVCARKALLPSLQYFFQFAPKAMKALEEYSNVSYSLPKMHHIAVPHFSSRATENWGAIIYRESEVVFGEAAHKDSLQDKQSVAMLATHELTHQWFGNLVGPFWWKHLWLNEGFAAYFQYFMTDKIEKSWRMQDLFLVQVIHSFAFRIDNDEYSQPIIKEVYSPTGIRQIFTPFVYRKAPAIIRMLSHVISEDVFHKGIQHYLRTNAFKSAKSDDFYESLQYVLDRSDDEDLKVSKMVPVKDLMDTWMNQSQYPLVTVKRNYSNGDIEISQECLTLDISRTNYHSCNNSWWVPISLATQSNPNPNSTAPSYWLKPDNESIVVKGVAVDDWVLVNVQGTGYYRVNYDEINWKRLIDYLDSANYSKIHVHSRLQILQDVYNLIHVMKTLPHAAFYNLTKYLVYETDALPWYSAFNHIQEADSLLAGTAAYPTFQKYILSVLQNHLEVEKVVEEDQDEVLLNQKNEQLLHWVCKYGQSRIRKYASERVGEYLQNPSGSRKTNTGIFCCAIRDANETVWRQMLEMHKNDSSSRKIWSFLSCSENQTIINNYLKTIKGIEKDKKLYDFLSSLTSQVTTNEKSSEPFGPSVAASTAFLEWFEKYQQTSNSAVAASVPTADNRNNDIVGS